VAKITFFAAIGPRGIIIVHVPEAESASEIIVVGILVWRFRLFETAIWRRPIISL
jgi:hypothetical protein